MTLMEHAAFLSIRDDDNVTAEVRILQLCCPYQIVIKRLIQSDEFAK
jgi:hypothetical protein